MQTSGFLELQRFGEKREKSQMQRLKDEEKIKREKTQININFG